MKKTLALVATLALVMGGCGKDGRTIAYKNVQIKELERRVAELEAALAACEAGGSSQPAPEFTPTADQKVPGNNGDVSWGSQDRDVVASVGSDVLFKPGSSILTDKAKKALDSVIDVIHSQYPNAKVRVEGHTDNQPIRRSKAENKDNWDLSGNRAQAVLHYLAEHGIAEEKLGFAGYGEQRPKGGNSSPDGMAKNRRVEIVVITN